MLASEAEACTAQLGYLQYYGFNLGVGNHDSKDPSLDAAFHPSRRRLMLAAAAAHSQLQAAS